MREWTMDTEKKSAEVAPVVGKERLNGPKKGTGHLNGKKHMLELRFCATALESNRVHLLARVVGNYILFAWHS